MSDLKFPAQTQVVIIGGGVIGCSVAYHLTKLGGTDVGLLERKELTCGTTWHAAGLVGQLRATRNMTMLAQYTSELFAGLEAETGQATGSNNMDPSVWHRTLSGLKNSNAEPPWPNVSVLKSR